MLYEDEKSEYLIIDIDLDSNFTNLDLITKVRPLNENADVILFFSLTNELKHDYSVFISYLKTNILHRNNVNVYFRGYFHLELFELLLNKKCHLSTDSKLVYDQTKLYKILKVIKDRPNILNKIIQKYTMAWYQFPIAYLPLTELNDIGIDYETF